MTSLEQQKRRLALVAKELETLPEETKTYQSVGKMFVRTDMPSNFKHIEEEVSSIGKTIHTVEVNAMNWLNSLPLINVHVAESKKLFRATTKQYSREYYRITGSVQCVITFL